MILKNLDVVVNIITILAALIGLIFTFGVVWRVEKKLDLSCKFFLLAILSYLAFLILEIVNPLDDKFTAIAGAIMKMFTSIFFLAGMYDLRDLIRSVDGEKKEYCSSKLRRTKK